MASLKDKISNYIKAKVAKVKNDFNPAIQDSAANKFWTQGFGNTLANAQTWMESPTSRIKLGNDFQYNSQDSDFIKTAKLVGNVGKGAVEGIGTGVFKTSADIGRMYGHGITGDISKFKAGSAPVIFGQDLATYAVRDTSGKAVRKPFDTVGYQGGGRWNVPLTGIKLPEFGLTESSAFNTFSKGLNAFEAPLAAYGMKNPKMMLAFLGFGSGVGGAVNYFGEGEKKEGSFSEGAWKTAYEMSPTLAKSSGLLQATNPATAVGKLPIRSLTNVLQGIAYDKVSGQETTGTSIFIDALFPVAGSITSKTFKSFEEAVKTLQGNILQSLGTHLRKSDGTYTTLAKFVKGTRPYRKQSMGAFLGFEMYQDEEGNWKINYNPKKSAMGLALMAGGTKVVNGLDDSFLKDMPDANKAQGVKALRETSKGANQLPQPQSLKGATQNLPTQQIGEASKISQKGPILQGDQVSRQFPYADNISQQSLKGKKTLFGNEPIETKAFSGELDEAGKAKIKRRAKLDAERAAKDNYQKWYRAQRESGQIKTTGEQLDVISKWIQSNTKGTAAKNISDIKDIGQTAKGFNTVKRNFKTVFGDAYGAIDKEILEPFARSKDQFTRELDYWSSKLAKLNIKKGSKTSAFVQMFGEKKITYEGLVSQIGEAEAKRVVEADKFFRASYDQLLDDLNAVRANIYPNNPEKIIPKRADYYRHFQEMQEGIGGLSNIFETPANIQSSLAGISADTKPKSSWLPFAQKRTGDKTTYDAVGGFIEYIKKAVYSKHIDPNIERFRSLATELEEATLEGPFKGKVNNFIEYLHDYANDLSGKSGPVERLVQKYVPGGRKAMRAIGWVNNRVKANVILMNLSSSLAQFFNIPQGVANAGVENSTKGLGRTLAAIFTENKPMKQSRFIRERYSDPFEQFDVGAIDEAKKVAKWIITVGDEIGTKFIWNSHYEKAIKEGIRNPIKYADEVTESMVAGRGIGEVPLMQKDKVMQLLIPFQLEVGNLWWVMKDWVSAKEYSKLAKFAVASYLMNRVAESIRGSDVSFDPINAAVGGIEALNAEEDKKIGTLKLAGRLSGEVLSNVPGGQSVAAAYPEYGFSVGDTKLPTRKDLFGEGDPTRYGSGLLVTKGIQDPLFKILPPFGGQQMKRSIEGVQAVAQGESKARSGDMQFPIEKNARNYLQAGAFGRYSIPDAQEYFDKERRPLSTKQSDFVRGSTDTKSAYNEIMDTRVANAEETKIRDEVRSTGEMRETDDKYIYWDSEKGETASIKKTFDERPPTLTGQTELDKKLLSDYKSSITRRINDIVKLYDLGQMTSEQAEEEIGKLSILKEMISQVTKSKKAKKISVRRGTVPKIKSSKPKTASLKAFKPSEKAKFNVKTVQPTNYKVSKADLDKLRTGNV